MDDEKIFQEWYCGNCSTYIRFRLCMGYNRVVWVECPMCAHRHQRFIKDGRIQDDGRFNHGEPVEDICPPKSACSKEPITKKLDKAKYTRDGIIIKSTEDLVRDNHMRERWIEIFGRTEGD
jgi:hypothetical protein